MWVLNIRFLIDLPSFYQSLIHPGIGVSSHVTTRSSDLFYRNQQSPGWNLWSNSTSHGSSHRSTIPWWLRVLNVDLHSSLYLHGDVIGASASLKITISLKINQLESQSKFPRNSLAPCSFSSPVRLGYVEFLSLSCSGLCITLCSTGNPLLSFLESWPRNGLFSK